MDLTILKDSSPPTWANSRWPFANLNLATALAKKAVEQERYARGTMTFRRQTATMGDSTDGEPKT
jgi:hypothetical protein